jgi:hypothetical protein
MVSNIKIQRPGCGMLLATVELSQLLILIVRQFHSSI